LWEFERYYPAASSVEAPPTQSRLTLGASEAENVVETTDSQ